MAVSVVRTRVTKESVPAVEDGIREMVAALAEAASAGVRYAYGRLPDGVTFFALLELDDGVANPLPDIPACQRFQANLRQHWLDQTEPPAPEPFEVIGAYRIFS